MQPTWDDIVRMRNKREDEPVQKRFAPFSHLGRGHLFPHLCGRMVQDA